MRNSRYLFAVLLMLLPCACGPEADAQQSPAAWEYAEMGRHLFTDSGKLVQKWWWEEGATPAIEAKTMEELGKALGAKEGVPHTTALVNLQASKGWEFLTMEKTRAEYEYNARYSLDAETIWMFRRLRR